MKIFKKKREKTIDFTKRETQVRKKPFIVNKGAVDLRGTQNQEKNENVDFTQNSPFNSSGSSSSVMDFLGGGSSSSEDVHSVSEISQVSEIKNKMKDVTGKIENLDNEFYRLMQKVEMLEKKIEKFENRGI